MVDLFMAQPGASHSNDPSTSDRVAPPVRDEMHVIHTHTTNKQTDRHESENRGHPFGSQDFVPFPSTCDQGAVQ